jgi:hypothetical protein
MGKELYTLKCEAENRANRDLMVNVELFFIMGNLMKLKTSIFLSTQISVVYQFDVAVDTYSG